VHNYDAQQHRAGQIISPLTLQTITIAQMLSVGLEGEEGIHLSVTAYYTHYKDKLTSVSLHCKSRRSKTANIKILSIRSTEASDHIYFSHRPVINVKAIFCA